MRTSDTDPSWPDRFRAFAVDCERACEEPGAAVRRLHALMLQGLGEHPAVAEQSDQLDRKIAAGALESAAISLAGSDFGYMISRSPEGKAVASTWSVEAAEEETVTAAHPAVALCGALARSFARRLEARFERKTRSVH